MDWINIKEKHFVKLSNVTKEGFSWIANENTPDDTFLVGLYVTNSTTEMTTFEWYRVLMTDDDLCEWSEEGDIQPFCWSITDVEYWMEITDPSKS